MLAMNVVLEEPAWPDLVRENKTVLHLTSPLSVAGLHAGMQSGAPAVALRIDLPDGHHVIVAETSLRLWIEATRVLIAHYGDPTHRGGV